jgi:hypothetical protein
MNDQELNALAAAIAAKMRPTISFDIDLWSSAEIALFLKRSQTSVTDRIVCLPSFPSSIRIPVLGSSGKSHPLWKATDVVDWAESHRERKSKESRR